VAGAPFRTPYSAPQTPQLDFWVRDGKRSAGKGKGEGGRGEGKGKGTGGEEKDGKGK